MVNEQDREKAREVFDYIELQFDEDPTYDMIDAGVAKIAAALAEAREEGHRFVSFDEMRISFSQGYAKAVEDAANKCQVHAEGNTRLCNDSAHDDRWCGTCSSMRDEADILEQAIRGLSLRSGDKI